jgi:nitrite reductase/ring-hydroxylating ferredoxin subunit
MSDHLAELDLFVVADLSGWGRTTTVVRAANTTEAIETACPHARAQDRERIEVTRLDDVRGILWSEEISPDSGACRED